MNISKQYTIPSSPGTYALTMKLAKSAEITVGKLGTFTFHPGYYIYTGSAFGPGGLQARVGRHLQKNKKLKWHIDYLREYMEITDIQFAEFAKNQECEWSAKFAENGGVFPAKGLGSSDCRCFSHLIYFNEDLYRIQKISECTFIKGRK
jgi:Uri superfamily endonuclease